ncbi:MAG: hypothetical protein L0Y71_00950 [Gemmataceae bacterium]|nr:hypothetical protein [Gemmataceae bacterium]
MLCWLCVGCVTTSTSQRPKQETPPVLPAYQVHATWENRVMITQDVVNNGKPLIGLAGRMYLFGQELGHPVGGDGMAIIELADVTHANAQNKPQLLERWEIDPATLQRLLRKDMIGWGYTLFLPWRTYRPDIAKVQMQVRYVPAKGLPLFSPPAVVTLRQEAPALAHSQRTVPASAVTPSPAILPPPPAPPLPVRP